MFSFADFEIFAAVAVPLGRVFAELEVELKYERTCLCPNVRSKFQLYKNFGEISVIKRPKTLKAKPRSLYTRIDRRAHV